jgi:hypothetical protein
MFLLDEKGHEKRVLRRGAGVAAHTRLGQGAELQADLRLIPSNAEIGGVKLEKTQYVIWGSLAVSGRPGSCTYKLHSYKHTYGFEESHTDDKSMSAASSDRPGSSKDSEVPVCLFYLAPWLVPRFRPSTTLPLQSPGLLLHEFSSAPQT